MELTITPKDELRELIREELNSVFKSLNIAPPPPLEENYITENEAKEILSVSKVTLKKWRDENRLKFYRFGTRIRYKKSELLETPKKFGRAAR